MMLSQQQHRVSAMTGQPLLFGHEPLDGHQSPAEQAVKPSRDKEMSAAVDQFKAASRSENVFQFSGSVLELAGQAYQKRVEPAQGLGMVAELQNKQATGTQAAIRRSEGTLAAIDVGENANTYGNVEAIFSNVVKIANTTNSAGTMFFASSINHGGRLINQGKRPVQPLRNGAVAAT